MSKYFVTYFGEPLTISDICLKSQAESEKLKGYSMKSKSWHSSKSHVYHDNKECNTGNNIETENIRHGKGDNRECKECKGLNKHGK
jgi:hypothetical protein